MGGGWVRRTPSDDVARHEDSKRTGMSWERGGVVWVESILILMKGGEQILGLSSLFYGNLEVIGGEGGSNYPGPSWTIFSRKQSLSY